jgi:hypothetical protein
MATPTRKGHNSAQSPATDLNSPVSDAVVAVTVHIKLTGSPAAVNADFATLAGTSLTSTSAQLSWDRS